MLDAQTKQNVHFEIGGRHTLGCILDDMGLSRAMVLTTPEQCDAAHEIAAIIGDLAKHAGRLWQLVSADPWGDWHRDHAVCTQGSLGTFFPKNWHPNLSRSTTVSS